MLVLKVEDLGVADGSRGDEFGVKELEDFVTNVGELRLDLGQKAPPKWVAIWVASPKWRVWCQNALSKWVAIRFFWVAIWVLCVCVCVFLESLGSVCVRSGLRSAEVESLNF